MVNIVLCTREGQEEECLLKSRGVDKSGAVISTLGLGVKCIILETGQETQQDPSRSQHEQQAAN